MMEVRRSFESEGKGQGSLAKDASWQAQKRPPSLSDLKSQQSNSQGRLSRSVGLSRKEMIEESASLPASSKHVPPSLHPAVRLPPCSPSLSLPAP